jgi:hypothetical protein
MEDDAIVKSHLELFGDLRRGGVDPWSLSRGSGLYFAYLEDVEAIAPGAGIVNTNQHTLARAPVTAGLRLLRFSAVPSIDFMRVSDGVSSLPPGDPSADERDQRRIELLIALREMDMPLLEVLLAPHHAARRFFDSNVAPWWFLVFHATGPDALSGIIPQAHFYSDAADQPVIVGELPVLAPAPERWNARLLDIFSLAHVPDADFGSRGNENEPSPLEPAPLPASVSDDLAESDELEEIIDLMEKLRHHQSGGSAAG